MLKGNYEVEILVNGSPVKEYDHKGRVYIKGKEGSAYKIKVRNNGCVRIKAVISVDGLSVMDGEGASLDGRGYIVNGFSNLVVDGWRKSDSAVAEFYFSDPSKSYAARSEKDRGNIGIIGVSIIEEAYITPTYTCEGSAITYRDLPKGTMGLSVTNCSYSAQLNSIGTGWGNEKSSNVTSVIFNGKSAPSNVFEIYYDTHDGLAKRGVDMDKHVVYVDSPQAFPTGFCKSPKY